MAMPSFKLTGADGTPIAKFVSDRLIFEEKAKSYPVAISIIQIGIEIPADLQKKWGCGKWVKYPQEAADDKEIELFKKVFLEYYYPKKLKSDGYKLTEGN